MDTLSPELYIPEDGLTKPPSGGLDRTDKENLTGSFSHEIKNSKETTDKITHLKSLKRKNIFITISIHNIYQKNIVLI